MPQTGSNRHGSGVFYPVNFFCTGAIMDRNKFFSGLDLLGRLLLAALFVSDVWTIVNNYGATADYLAQFGVPPLLLPIATVVQLGGGLLVAIGWQTRLAALALAFFCVSTALIFHSQFADPNEAIHFWKDLALAGGFLVLLAHGAGAWSLDARLRRR
jgi:putative oxidoreductase